jgi:hypothetical protein
LHMQIVEYDGKGEGSDVEASKWEMSVNTCTRKLGARAGRLLVALTITGCGPGLSWHRHDEREGHEGESPQRLLVGSHVG